MRDLLKYLSHWQIYSRLYLTNFPFINFVLCGGCLNKGLEEMIKDKNKGNDVNL